MSTHLKTFIQFWMFFSTLKPFFEAGRRFLTKSHGPECDDDEVKLKIFEKKVVYSFLLRIKIQEENIYSILGVFFDIEAIF